MRGVGWGSLGPLYLQLGSPLFSMTVQPGLLGLQVLSEGVLQCRTQQWKSSASTNTEGERKKERDRERERGRDGGRGREGRGEKGVGGSNHVISLLLTSPRAATKGGMLSYVLYRVTLPCFLYEKKD